MATSVAEVVTPTPDSKLSVPSFDDYQESCSFDLLEHMGQLFDVTQDLLCVMGFDGRIRYLNGSWEQALGYTRPELMATPLREKIHPEDREATVADIEKVRAGVPTKSFENRLRCKDGSYKWFSWSGTASEKQGCFYVSGRDITETKQSQASVLRLAQALEHSSEMICMTDGEGRAVFANQALLDVSGYRRDEILGKPFSETLLSGANQLTLAQDIRDALTRRGKWTGECLQRRKNGPDIPISLSLGLIRDRSGRPTGAYGISYDITERKRTELALRLSERNYRSFVDKAPYAICRATMSGQLLQINQAMLETLKYEFSEDLLEKNLPSIFELPKHFDDFRKALLDAGALQGFGSTWRRSDGGEIQVSISGRAVRDDAGEVEYLDVVAENVTERKRLEAQLQQAQKMQAIGQLAGGVAHDFNNLLTIIGGQVEVVLLREFDADVKLRLEEVKRAANRAARLTSQLLTFSRRQVLQSRVLELNRVISDMSRMLTRLIGENIELTFIPGDDLGRVKADPHQVEQVLMNLAVNARDAMPRGGRLTIETMQFKIAAPSSPETGGITPGQYVLIKVIDTGHGMDQATMSHIFEPFFTTKKTGEGTGLGLAMVYGIVEQSGGHIRVESRVGHGSTFKIYLPCVPEVETSLPAPVPIASAGGSEGILLVEDNQSVRELAAAYLQGLGYRVLTAHDGSVAVKIMETRSGDVDLLLSDIMMPNMGGPELARELKRSHPTLKVVFVSGYAGHEASQQDLSIPGAAFLAKPFSMQTLARTVRQALDGLTNTPQVANRSVSLTSLEVSDPPPERFW